MQTPESKYQFYRHLSIAYKNAAKLLKRAAAIHVEASDDKIFWENIFRKVLPGSEFHFITYTRTKEGNHATGCSVCMSYKDFLSKEFFVCIDSDYRYLLQEKNINIQHAIFQTYTYSIENHYCFSKGINKVFEWMGFKNEIFNFEDFLIRYSSVLYELFLFHLHSLTLRDNIFTKDDFKLYIGIDRPGLSIEKMLDGLEKKVNKKLQELKTVYPDPDIIKQQKIKYKKLGLNKSNGYLYFRGHNVFDRVVLPVAREVRKALEIQYVSRFPNEMKKQFFEGNKDLKSFFFQNIHPNEYDEIKKVEQDIRNFFMNNN